MNKTKMITAFEKVKRVIESCDTYQQLQVSDNMIDGFKAFYGYNEYSRELDIIWMEKQCCDELEWQPCGRAHQQTENATHQLEMLDRFNEYITGQ